MVGGVLPSLARCLRPRRADRRDGVADRGALGRVQSPERLADESPVGRRSEGELRPRRERDDPDAELLRDDVDQPVGCVLGGGQPAGADVRGAHRTGGVDREHHGRLLPLDADGRVRPRDADEQRRERGEEDRHRDVPAPSGEAVDEVGEEAG